jgi:methyltransferase family protein
MSLFHSWLRELEERHLADLRFAEVTRALRALSATYIERRHRLDEGAALAGAGKRAAFALFYGPLHFLTVREVVGALDISLQSGAMLVDLGCGTGAAGAAWAVSGASSVSVLGIDRNAWALAQADRTYRHFGLRARTRQADVAKAPLPQAATAFLAAFAINELPEAARDGLLPRLLDRAARGHAVLVVEPLARAVAPWWRRWTTAVEGAGGRADEWRFRVELPDIVAKLDRAAGLDHRELTARSLWFPSRSG